jgi:hypothetical protein
MTKVRSVLGLVAAAILILSSAAHSLLGGPALHSQLVALSVPRELIRTLQFGWHFGGLAMLAFGIIAMGIFVALLRGRNVSAFPALVIGITYLAFAAWALAVTRNPFFAVFLAPGAMLVFAAWRR